MRDAIETLSVLLRFDRSGVTAVEYAIIAGAVALVIGLAFASLGGSINTAITSVTGEV